MKPMIDTEKAHRNDRAGRSAGAKACARPVRDLTLQALQSRELSLARSIVIARSPRG